uniref:Uncharacterized protein n=1 Tax=Oryza sativa subsp. japonica TaxID=39947 RepID=Q69IR9_ORYSJ|nr:hypothetical protein [Oryza sativa Japonica Group]
MSPPLTCRNQRAAAQPIRRRHLAAPIRRRHLAAPIRRRHLAFAHYPLHRRPASVISSSYRHRAAHSLSNHKLTPNAATSISSRRRAALFAIRTLDNTEDLVDITGADMDPADYAEAHESFKAQGKTEFKHEIINPHKIRKRTDIPM